MKYICVFCGSSTGNRPAYKQAAQAMGEAIARRGLGLVYGSGNVYYSYSIAPSQKNF